ncbi:hypothetical protein DZD52_13215 [Xanthomonas nasturtii]|uniref:Uncharacterized protein n=1 Tax=Xanthomonas nasturtii TaxID=1843581 RepID=A0A3E1KI74_9XANT|nr:hypothetical protein DZD52_13215 [Xanthomonas nasturtii]
MSRRRPCRRWASHCVWRCAATPCTSSTRPPGSAWKWLRSGNNTTALAARRARPVFGSGMDYMRTTVLSAPSKPADDCLLRF